MIILLILILSVLGGCMEQNRQVSFEYSNMVDIPTRNEINTLLLQSGVNKENSNLFFEFIDDFYKVPYEGIAEKGFVSKPLNDFTYKSFSIQDNTKHWNELGFDNEDYDINCRVAAFTLMQDFISLQREHVAPLEIIDENIIYEYHLFDHNQEIIDKYALLFNNVSVSKSDNKADVVSKIQYNWNDLGLDFKKDVPIKLISMYIQNRESNILQIAHAAVLLETPDFLYLIEKYNPQEPYQVSKFKHIDEINTYLLQRLNQDKINSSQNIVIMLNDDNIY